MRLIIEELQKKFRLEFLQWIMYSYFVLRLHQMNGWKVLFLWLKA